MKTKLYITIFILLTFSGVGQVKSQESLPDTVWTKRLNDISEIGCVKFSPDGKIIAVGTYGFNWDNGIIFLIETETGNIIRELKGHSKEIISLDFSLTGDTLLSAGKEVILWDVNTGEIIKTYSEYYFKAIFMEDDNRILSLKSPEEAKKLVIFDKNTGMIERSQNFSEIPNFIYSTVSNKLIIEQTIFFPGEGKNQSFLKLWDANTFEKIADLGNHDDQITDMAFSPDGSLLATSSFDQTVKIWDIANKKLLKNIEPNYSFLRSNIFSNDTNYLIIGFSYVENCGIFIWDIKSQSFVKEIKNDSFCSTGMDMSPNDNNKLLIYSGRNLRLINLQLQTIGVVQTFENIKSILYPNPTNNIANIQFYLENSDNIEIKLYDISSNLIEKIYNGFLNSGNQTIPYNCSNLSSGIYYIKISSPNLTLTIKLVKEG